MSIAYGPKKIIRAASGGANHVSTDSGDATCLGRSCDLSLYNFASIQLVWSGLGGTPNGTATVEVSEDGTNWDTKKIEVAGASVDAVIALSGAAGNDTLSIETVTERYYRVSYVKGTTTGGSIDCILMAKGS